MREGGEKRGRPTGGMVVLHDCTGGDDGEGVEVGVRSELGAEDGELDVVAGPGDGKVVVGGVDEHVDQACLLPPPRCLTRCVLSHPPPTTTSTTPSSLPSPTTTTTPLSAQHRRPGPAPIPPPPSMLPPPLAAVAPPSAACVVRNQLSTSATSPAITSPARIQTTLLPRTLPFPIEPVWVPAALRQETVPSPLSFPSHSADCSPISAPPLQISLASCPSLSVPLCPPLTSPVPAIHRAPSTSTARLFFMLKASISPTAPNSASAWTSSSSTRNSARAIMEPSKRSSMSQPTCIWR